MQPFRPLRSHRELTKTHEFVIPELRKGTTMRKIRSIHILLCMAALLAMSFGSAMAGGLGCQSKTTASIENASYKAGLQKAEQSGLPVLIKVGAEWCKACNAFDKAAAGAGDVNSAIFQERRSRSNRR